MASFILVVLFLIPILYAMVKTLDRRSFCRFLAHVNLVSFMFGYHVHEKAALMIQIPMALTIHQDSQLEREIYILTNMVLVWTFMPLWPVWYTMESLPMRLIILAVLGYILPRNLI